MLRKCTSTLVGAATALLLTTPLHGSPIDKAPSVRGTEAIALTVRVRNEFRYAVTIQLITESGHTINLGPVEAGSGLIAQIDESVFDGSEPLKLRVRSMQGPRVHLGQPLVAYDAVVSRPFTAEAGAMVEMHVSQVLRESRVWVQR